MTKLLRYLCLALIACTTIGSSAFGLSQIPLIMRNLTSPDAPVDPMAPAEPDTAP